MKSRKTPGVEYESEKESGLAQTTEWDYHAELDGAKFRTRFERESELGEHLFVVEEFNPRDNEWVRVWANSWIGRRWK